MMLLSNNLPRFLPRSFTNSCEKVGRGEKSSLLRFVKLFATTTTAGLLPEGCQFVTRKLSSSPITTTRSRERIVAESLSLFVLICSPELRLAHFFIRSRKGEGVRAELFDSLRENLVSAENGREESVRDENVNFFSRGPFYYSFVRKAKEIYF